MTAQLSEVLILNGKKVNMLFCPPFPKEHPRITATDPDDFTEEEERECFNTACWRGYQGTWEIKNGRFYLVRLMGAYRMRGGKPMFAKWFSGVLRIPKGKMVCDIYMGFASVYEREIYIKIEKGMVAGIRFIDNRGKTFDKLLLTSNNMPGEEDTFPVDDIF